MHALDDDDFGLGRLALFNGDDAVGGTDQFHRLGQFLTDLGIIIGGDRRHLGDFLLILVVNLFGQAVQLIYEGFDALLNTSGQRHRIGTRGDVFQTFAIDGLGQNSRRGCAVAGHVARFAGRFLDELRPHVLIGILQLNLLSDGDAVLGNIRTPPALIEHGIPAARPQSRSNRTCQLADAGQ